MSKHNIYKEVRDMKYFTSKTFRCNGCDYRSSDYNKAKQHANTKNYNDKVDESVYPDINGIAI